MHTETSLAQAFIEAHPAEAASLLEGLPADELGSLIGELAPPIAARCLAHFTNPRGAEILSAASPGIATAILGAMQAHQAAALLRAMPADERERRLAGMPTEVSEPFRRLLRHPEGTAGAMMDPHVAPVPGDISVVAARELLRCASQSSMHYVYVVERDDRLIGVLDPRQLMVASPKRSLGELMQRPVSTLPSGADRKAVLDHPAWRRLDALPVVDPSGRFLGVVTHKTIRQLNLDAYAKRQTEGAIGSVLAFGELCWITWSQILSGMATLAGSTPARRRREQEVEYRAND